jgi:hypothetical protein
VALSSLSVFLVTNCISNFHTSCAGGMDSLRQFPQERDGELSLNFTAQSKILTDLDGFVRLSRSRKFKAAIGVFDINLEQHVDEAFLVVIEYADLLLEQGDYRTLSDFLTTRIAAWSTIGEKNPEPEEPSAEIQLLMVMKSLADIFTKGALRSALVQALRCKNYLTREHSNHLKDPKHLPTNIQVGN